MLAFSPEVLADPLGVVAGLVCRADPALQRDAVEDVVTAVAPGRAVRRRLAQALSDRPALLEDGASPAPRVAGELLVALGRLGSTSIAAPRCAGCNKALRSFQRRGEQWYCTPCAVAPVACAACGRLAKLAFRDRAGRPRCCSCPPDDGPEPSEILLRVIAGIEPSLDARTVLDAFEAVCARAGWRRQLAWALEQRPDLLTGAGAEAPLPSVLRLIDALCAQGATRIVRPACPHCRRVVTLSKLSHSGLRICRGCDARLHAVPCTRCHAVRDPVSRDENGGPLCASCFARDPDNAETCVRCRRRRPVSVRSPSGPLCASCRPGVEMTCSICCRVAPCEISKATGLPRCNACQSRWARCARCQQFRAVRAGSISEPLCATCTRDDQSFWKACPDCGEQTKHTEGPCARCVLRRRLQHLLAGPSSTIRPELRALLENLAAVDRPATVSSWLGGEAAAVLGAIGAGRLALSHESLDELPSTKPLEHLRAVLVSSGALPARDEQMARLERWASATIAGRIDPEERQLLTRYALWHLLRRLRHRAKGGETTAGQVAVFRRRVRCAIALLDWLASRGLHLATAHQGQLEAWLASEGAKRRGDVGHFVRWAAAEKLTRLELAAIRWGGPSAVIDGEQRWSKARRLLADDSLDQHDRVAGLLVLLYAQRAATISRLRLDQVTIDADGVRLSLGDRPLLLPEPLDALVAGLVASRRGHATLGDSGSSPWLFPGGQPGRPISASRLNERLRDLGIAAGPARSAALLQLATELPAAVLARMLGVHIKVAVAWQRAASGDWAVYAAEYSRRGSEPRSAINRS